MNDIVSEIPTPSAVDWTALREVAAEARTRAYAPYSNFAVGAAGLCADGRVFAGCNVENASYGLSLCAECVLVGNLVVAGGGRLVAVSVAGPGADPLTPCGRCRQLLIEHGGPELQIDAVVPVTIGDLLPAAFGPHELR